MATYWISHSGVQLTADGGGAFIQGLLLLLLFVITIVQVCTTGRVLKGGGHALAPLAPRPDGSDRGGGLP